MATARNGQNYSERHVQDVTFNHVLMLGSRAYCVVNDNEISYDVKFGTQ